MHPFTPLEHCLSFLDYWSWLCLLNHKEKLVCKEFIYKRGVMKRRFKKEVKVSIGFRIRYLSLVGQFINETPLDMT